MDFSNGNAANMLVKASRPSLIQRLRRTYAASFNENPVCDARSWFCSNVIVCRVRTRIRDISYILWYLCAGGSTDNDTCWWPLSGVVKLIIVMEAVVTNMQWSWPNLRYYPESRLDGLGKTTKNIDFPSLISSGFKRESPECKTESVMPKLSLSVVSCRVSVVKSQSWWRPRKVSKPSDGYRGQDSIYFLDKWFLPMSDVCPSLVLLVM
jgi:hypothetical protein